MPSAQTIKLILGVVVVTGLVIVVGATVKSGRTASPPGPVTRQILRPKDRKNKPASAAEIAKLRSKAQDQEKRVLQTRDFKDMPLKYHIIRNVESETWYKDLQIEVKNIGTKPIYGILALLEFPDHKPLGRDIGFHISFGDIKYWDTSLMADPQDPHLDPGQTYVFTIPPKNARTLGKKYERAPQEFKKLNFRFTVITFGDGTGFEADAYWI